MAQTESTYQAEAVARLQAGAVFQIALSKDVAFLRRVRAVAAERIAELAARTGDQQQGALFD